MIRAATTSLRRHCLSPRYSYHNISGVCEVSRSIASFNSEEEPKRRKNIKQPPGRNGGILQHTFGTKFIGLSSSTMLGISRPDALISSSNILSIRAMSTARDFTDSNSPSTPEDAIAKFEQMATENDAAASIDVVAIDPSAWNPVWYYPQDHMIDFINYLHDFSGMNYAITISALTLAVRVVMFPLFVGSQKNNSRMAHMKPELDVLYGKVEKCRSDDHESKQKLVLQTQALYKRYDVKFYKALAPILQAPVFMSMFFGLRKMPEYFEEELSTGGIYWFTDLTASDPFYIMPIFSALSFLLMMEMGKEQLMANNPNHAKTMMLFFRGLAVVMVPITMNFPCAVFCYWTTNNTLSLCQNALFRMEPVRKMFGIWEPPKPVPGAPPPKGIMESLQEAVGKAKNKNKNSNSNLADQIKAHNEQVESKQRAKVFRKKRRTKL